MQSQPLRVLQIGAGSMGTRRLRDLSDCAPVKLALYDSRADRRERALAAHPHLATFADLDEALAWQPAVLSISTPPDQHDKYIDLALERGLHHFCEANIWTMSPKLVEEASARPGLVSAPSCSLYFLPAVQELLRIVRDELGGLHGYQMALNTYMPDWHPGEGAEYYARRRNTAAGREMVPFELLWLNQVFGTARQVQGIVTRVGTLPGVVEDMWTLQMELAGGGTGQIMVLMASPGALRQGWCFGERGQVFFDLFAGVIHRDYRNGVHDRREFGQIKDVLEETYRRETTTFIDVIRGNANWPQSYRATALATATLAAAETSAASGQRCPVNVDVQPRIHQD